jgi:hypothetical protein
MNSITILLIVLSVVSIGLSLFILTRIKHLVYLLEQPIVKKMTPDMKLKAVKVDDADDSRRHGHRHGNGQGNPSQSQGRPQSGPRPHDGQPQGGNRERRPEGQQGQRGDRPERGERPEHRGERNERGQEHRGNDRHRDRDRDRGPRQDRGDRPDRGERGERPERQRPRLDVFSNDTGAPAPESAPRAEQGQGERPVLAPRRPLAASVDREESPAAISSLPAAPELPPDAIFVGDDGDVQHGRRSSVKKKPRFEIDEEEAKAEENKVQA